jgi:hypothetical protein
LAYVDLNRTFAPIGKDAEPDLAFGPRWGLKYGGWLTWKELLSRRRVVLLAEASSGKTEEFKNTAASLRVSGNAAFFIPIEHLADGVIEGALGPEAALFGTWKSGTSPAWFFLDSVDEARLVQKSFDRALRQLALQLGPNLGRARVLISCRVSDWRGTADRESIEQALPAGTDTSIELPHDDDPEAPLLEPIFGKRKEEKRPSEERRTDDGKLLVVQLTPLSDDQRRLLAISAGVANADEFVAAIEGHGLEGLAERPGDLLELASYWNTHGRFASLSEMMRHGLRVKLREPNKFRADNVALSLDEAIQGTQRIASALTLSKSLTVLAAGERHPSYTAGALDPELILDDWTGAKVNALVRRGIFAPSTYGRVRFHHRSTQEYLTGAWLNQLLSGGLPRQELFDLLFVERYGIKTVVPSLRPAAAWLAQWQVDVRDELLLREPLTLIREADPSVLPIDTKRKLLLHLAQLHQAGKVADDTVDRRSLWMFASPDLADSIREAWKLNQRSDFRLHMLLLIKESRITTCSDLAAGVALEENEGDYTRIVALEALKACAATSPIETLTQALLRDPARPSPRLFSGFVRILFPEHLTVAQLVKLIDSATPPRPDSSHGIQYSLQNLWDACPAIAKAEFLDGLANLCLQEPFVDKFERVSKKHHELAKHVASIAASAVKELEERAPSVSLIRLLSVAERAEHGRRIEDDEVNLTQLVREHRQVNRALFWHDVAEDRAQRSERGLVSVWQIHFGGFQLWELSEDDVPWLRADLLSRQEVDDRRMALSAILSVLARKGEPSEAVKGLREEIRHDRTLVEDLDDFLAPHPRSEEAANGDEEMRRRESKRRKERKAAERSWIEFRVRMQANPAVLYDPNELKGKGFNALFNLTKWLRDKTHKETNEAARQWPVLRGVYGVAVAQAYRDGMKALWRVIEPEAPARGPGGPITTKWTTILAYAGVGVEAAEDRTWAAKLSSAEAIRAAMHGCISDQGYPDWIESLLEQHSSSVVPIVRDTFMREWLAETEGSLNFVYHYGNRAGAQVHAALRAEILKVIMNNEPKRLLVMDYGLRVLGGLKVSSSERRALVDYADQKFLEAAAARQDWAVRYLAILFLNEPAKAVTRLRAWIKETDSVGRKALAENAFAALFGQRDPLVPISLKRVSIPVLEDLVRLAHQEIRPEHDRVHPEGTYSPNERDEAEDARWAVLRALLDSHGQEAFDAVLRLANSPDLRSRRIRILELARGMAERDAETEPWEPAEVLAFERRGVRPVKSAADLFQLILSVLDDITWSFDNQDASSKSVLETAADEDAVQNWLAEQLRLRASGRYHVIRENEVAGGNLPDITVTSATGLYEVAIEAKHGGKGWTVARLEAALRQQLAEDYLRPENRRHGILVVTHHGNRAWQHPSTGKPMTFTGLIEHLVRIAGTLKRNSAGVIQVEAKGIDASPRGRSAASRGQLAKPSKRSKKRQ